MKKGRDDHDSSFVRLERRLLFKVPEWRHLSARAKIVYLYLKAKYNGPTSKGHITNNGQIQLCFSEVSDMPELKSRGSFYGAIRELKATGWIDQTNTGGLYRNPNNYRLTWKFDVLE